MPLTAYQRRVCRLLAAERASRGERYVAGGAALNELLAAPRISHDVDLFHDAAEAVLVSWTVDSHTPDIEELGKRWRKMLHEADDIATRLPEDRVGTCVLTRTMAMRYSPLLESFTCPSGAIIIFSDQWKFHHFHPSVWWRSAAVCRVRSKNRERMNDEHADASDTEGSPPFHAR